MPAMRRKFVAIYGSLASGSTVA